VPERRVCGPWDREFCQVPVAFVIAHDEVIGGRKQLLNAEGRSVGLKFLSQQFNGDGAVGRNKAFSLMPPLKCIDEIR